MSFYVMSQKDNRKYNQKGYDHANDLGRRAQPLEQAVILTGGFGTRFLPATRAYPKALLNLVDRPVSHYLVDEVCASGIRDIVFLTGAGSVTVKNYFKKATKLELFLKEKGKGALADELKNVSALARFRYVAEETAQGTGGAVLQVADYVENKPFALMYSDDLIDADTPGIAQLANVFYRFSSPVLALERVPKRDVYNYGVIRASKMEKRLYKIEEVVEKPRSNPPSNLVSVGRFILTPALMPYVYSVKPRSHDNEICLTEAINAFIADGNDVYGYELEGKRFDCGSKLGYMKASVHFALKHPEIGKQFRACLKNIGGKNI